MRKQAELQRLAEQWAPAGVEVVYVDDLRGQAQFRRAGCRLLAPRPTDLERLYVFLHECAHFHLRHDQAGRTPIYLLEMEAELWAQTRLLEAGLSIPARSFLNGRWYIGRKIEKAIRAGAKRIARVALDYAGEYAEVTLALGQIDDRRRPRTQRVVHELRTQIDTARRLNRVIITEKP